MPLESALRGPIWPSRKQSLAREVFAMFECLFSSFDTDSVFDEFRRLENEMVQLFGHSPWPAGIRALGRGTFPPLNVGATPERVDVYLFAANLEPKSLDLSIQQNLLTVSGARNAEVNEKAQYYRRERFDGEFQPWITLRDKSNPG